jgi:hypothetical protein
MLALKKPTAMPKAMISQKDRKLDTSNDANRKNAILSILKAYYNNPTATCQRE